MTIQWFQETQLKVAIEGAGPAGLATAIEIAKLPFVDWTLYERGDIVKEIGAGISIQPNTWRMLDEMGASKNLVPDDFYRPPDGHYSQHRNGKNGELLASHILQDVKSNHVHARCHRAKLQNALLREVNHTRIRLSHKLVKVEKRPSGRVLIQFANRLEDEVDLLVGADGIRSVVRSVAFPDHRVSYTGKTSYRTLVKTDDVERIAGLPDAITFWHAPNGEWVYTANLNGNVYEITTLTKEPADGKDRVSWGQDSSVQQMRDHFLTLYAPIQELLALPSKVQQYALFAGPRLPTVVSPKLATALIGDASHPLSGAFGAGAGFALEDAWTLARSLKWAHAHSRSITDALNLFDGVRSPHYSALYSVLDQFKKTDEWLQTAGLGWDDEVKARIDNTWSVKHSWIYKYNVQDAFRKATEGVAKDGRLNGHGLSNEYVPRKDVNNIQANL